MEVQALNPAADPIYPARTTTYTGTAGDTATWPPGPNEVLVWCSTDAYVLVGEGVTATTALGTPITAGTMVKFRVPPGGGGAWRVSAIQVGSGGSVYAKPLENG